MNEMGNNDLIFDDSKNAAFLKGEKKAYNKRQRWSEGPFKC